MKKIVLGITAMLAFGTSAMAEQVKIGVAAEPYPPFASPDANGNWVGWEIDFMNAICKQAALDCVITPTAWDGIIPALTSGQIDVIMASMSKTEERAKIIDFSDKYYDTPSMIITAKEAGIAPTPEGLKGKIVGVQSSTTQEVYAQKHFAESEVKAYPTADEVNQDLAAGRVDAVLADSIALQAFLDSDAGKACCISIGMAAGDPSVLGGGTAFGVRQGDPVLGKLNDAIKAIRADGTYDAITKNYFNFDIYGE